MAALVAGESPTPRRPRGSAGSWTPLCAFDKPLLAAVNGVGVGLGFTILAHCDLVLVSEDARLRVPFAELGVPAEAASSYLFPLRMGWQRAAEVLLTGAWVSATEAVDSGIALRAVPARGPAGRDDGAGPADRGRLRPTRVRAIKRLMLAAAGARWWPRPASARTRPSPSCSARPPTRPRSTGSGTTGRACT